MLIFTKILNAHCESGLIIKGLWARFLNVTYSTELIKTISSLKSLNIAKGELILVTKKNK